MRISYLEAQQLLAEPVESINAALALEQRLGRAGWRSSAAVGRPGEGVWVLARVWRPAEGSPGEIRYYDPPRIPAAGMAALAPLRQGR